MQQVMFGGRVDSVPVTIPYFRGDGGVKYCSTFTISDSFSSMPVIAFGNFALKIMQEVSVGFSITVFGKLFERVVSDSELDNHVEVWLYAKSGDFTPDHSVNYFSLISPEIKQDDEEFDKEIQVDFSYLLESRSIDAANSFLLGKILQLQEAMAKI